MPVQAASLPASTYVPVRPARRLTPRQQAVWDGVEDLRVTFDKLHVLALLIIERHGDTQASTLADAMIDVLERGDQRATALLERLR